MVLEGRKGGMWLKVKRVKERVGREGRSESIRSHGWDLDVD